MIRIVKLHFHEDKLEDFLAFFETIKHKVREFPGCEAMRLLQDRERPSIVMTYSDWRDAADLETYRHSETFASIWSHIKPWFKEKAEAWSVDVVDA
jgi:autoinducer 2-degrading protein